MLKQFVVKYLARKGFVHTQSTPTYADLEPDFLRLYERCRPYTMTSIDRMYALYQAVQHVVAQGLPGAFVECGVWRGGSTMLTALTLQHLGVTDRDLWLYDTFEGMSAPTEKDRDFRGEDAHGTWAESQTDTHNAWCYASLTDVQQALASTGYPAQRLHYVQGMVEATLPGTLPGPIALLRLDTDFYDSTWQEFVHLYPLLASGGVLIVDDYGHWQGAREATDAYFDAHPPRPLLHRIDYTGRIGLKP